MSTTKKLVKNNYKVKFELPKELVPSNATDVRVLGSFNDWTWEKGVSLKLTKDTYVAEVALPAGKVFEYRFLVDNYFWTNDNKADDYKHCNYAGTENSVLVLSNPTDTKTTATKTATAKTTAPKVKKATATKTATAKVVAPKAAKKTTAKKATTTKKYDFTVIEGVGPKINKLIIYGGYKTFGDLAKAKVADLQTILDNAGSRYKMHNPSTWTEQATLASQEKWAELKTLQAKLNGGKTK
jgi:predicted flap endonuclease-1-like 5' DNA nuclease